MPSQYATLSRYITFSVDMVCLSSDIFSDKTGSFLILVLSPYMEDLQTLQKLAGRINTFRNPILGHKDNAAFLSELHMCIPWRLFLHGNSTSWISSPSENPHWCSLNQIPAFLQNSLLSHSQSIQSGKKLRFRSFLTYNSFLFAPSQS